MGEKLPRGGQTLWDDAIAAEIVSRVANGEPLAQICRLAYMPGLRTVYDWADARPEFAARIAKARESGYDMIAQDVLRIVDEEPRMIEGKWGDIRMDAGQVAWMRVRAETRLKLLAKWDPKRYGEKLAVEGSVHNTHSFPAAFHAAMTSMDDKPVVSESAKH
jgi:hypothetical protein